VFAEVIVIALTLVCLCVYVRLALSLQAVVTLTACRTCSHANIPAATATTALLKSMFDHV